MITASLVKDVLIYTGYIDNLDIDTFLFTLSQILVYCMDYQEGFGNKEPESKVSNTVSCVWILQCIYIVQTIKDTNQGH